MTNQFTGISDKDILEEIIDRQLPTALEKELKSSIDSLSFDIQCMQSKITILLNTISDVAKMTYLGCEEKKLLNTISDMARAKDC